MRIIHSTQHMLRWRQQQKNSVKIGFVPTMGALHEGHLSLIKKSIRENEVTAVSIFVNPIQFRPTEDLARYPRPFDKDCSLLKKAGVNLLFAPDISAMYPLDSSTRVEVSSLNRQLCGDKKFRGPEHFNGVSTVVAKLFNLVRPTRAYFGMKDFQQLRVLEQMNQDLNFGIKIVRCPTVREKDGLAMSSRNAYLSIENRQKAPAFYSALQAGRKLLTSKTSKNPKKIRAKVMSILSSIPSIKVEYVELVEAISLTTPLIKGHDCLLAAAIYIGSTRLIDNILIPTHA